MDWRVLAFVLSWVPVTVGALCWDAEAVHALVLRACELAATGVCVAGRRFERF